MNLIAKVQYGSRLYGTTVPTSDIDHRSVYLPPLTELILGTARHAWEDKTKDDTSYFSLHHFLRLAAEGQSIAIEMLAAPADKVVTGSELWSYLQAERKRFYTKNMYSFLGFARTIASKYSSRVDRLNEVQAIMDVLTDCNDGSDPRLGTIWDHLPVSLNAEKTTNERNLGGDKRAYRVCGRELQATVTIEHAYCVIKTLYDSYGERVRRAKYGQFDWKSLGHAFRAALQCKEIVETGDLHFPLRDAEWLREVRLGHVDFIANTLDKKLDDLILEVQGKMDASSLPEKVDQRWVDGIILDAYRADHS